MSRKMRSKAAMRSALLCYVVSSLQIGAAKLRTERVSRVTTPIPSLCESC